MLYHDCDNYCSAIATPACILSFILVLLQSDAVTSTTQIQLESSRLEVHPILILGLEVHPILILDLEVYPILILNIQAHPILILDLEVYPILILDLEVHPVLILDI